MSNTYWMLIQPKKNRGFSLEIGFATMSLQPMPDASGPSGMPRLPGPVLDDGLLLGSIQLKRYLNQLP